MAAEGNLELVSCPICGEKIRLPDINSHVDSCLSGYENNSEVINERIGNADVVLKNGEENTSDNKKSKHEPGKMTDPQVTIVTSPRNLSIKATRSLSDVLGKRKRSAVALDCNAESPKSRRKEDHSWQVRDSIDTDEENNWNCSSRPQVTAQLESCSGNNEETLSLPHISKKQGEIKRPNATITRSLSITEGSKDDRLSDKVPLAEQMRPVKLEEYIGQSSITEGNTTLMKLIKSNDIPSLILWGPPGCGKTTLAYVIGCNCKKSGKARFVRLSATTGSISEAKEVIKKAKNEKAVIGRKTILFIDEIHRFNKLQQDTFLPHVENGTIVLIGATTENPSFHVNNALLSRCKVIVLEKLKTDNIRDILLRAVTKLDGMVINKDGKPYLEEGSESMSKSIQVEWGAINYLAQISDGDARAALNGLEMTLRSISAARNDVMNGNDMKGPCIVTTEMAQESMQRNHVQYDRNGDEHYNMASALQKSIRGGDDNAALYWLARMLEGGENPLYVARRLIRMAGEDVGLADVKALQVAVSAYQASHLIGMPECDVILAEAAVYLARAPKSFEVYGAYQKAKAAIKYADGPLPGVPLHLRNASTKLMKSLGYAAGYQHDPSCDQTYLPDELKDVDFFEE